MRRAATLQRFAAAMTALFCLALPVAWAAEAPVLSGGVGIAERESLEAQAGAYNLKLVFVLSTGNYLSDIGFEIADSGGRTVARHVAPGPVAYAKLAPGRYRVTARFGASTQTKNVSVGARGRATLFFRWRGMGDTPAA